MLTMNINVSGVQLAQPSFVDRIVEIMDQRGISSEQINLEVTESVGWMRTVSCRS